MTIIDPLILSIPLALLAGAVTAVLVMRTRMRVAVEAARREALDEFVREIRIEERSHFRESKSMFSSRRNLVLQERLCFRDIPLSNWVEREVAVEDAGERAKPPSVFMIPEQL